MVNWAKCQKDLIKKHSVLNLVQIIPGDVLMLSEHLSMFETEILR